MSATPGGMHDRWSKLRPYRTDDRHDADVLRLLAAFDWAHRDEPARRIAAPAPGGASLSFAAKSAIFERYEALRADHRARHGRGWSITPAGGRPPVYASAAPPDHGPSELVKRIFGLD
jgi:hypothetical protein